MKKIAIISNIPTTADNHRTTLENIFPKVRIDVYPISERPSGHIRADVALVTALDLVPYAQKHLDPDCVVVQGTYTLEKAQLQAIRALAHTGTVVVAHETSQAVLTRCTLLQRLGISADRLQIWYPGMSEEALNGHVVLFGDMVLPGGRVPALRVGGRILSVTTIFEVAIGLGVYDVTSSASFQEYLRQVCTQFRPSINDLSVSEINAITGNEAPQQGLLAFTGDLLIFYCDFYVASLVGRTPQNLIGLYLYDALPFLRSCPIQQGNDAPEQLVVHSGRTYAVKLNRVRQTGRETGYLQISDYWAEEQRQGKLRRQVTGNKSNAKYTFRDIVGASQKLSECKAIAQRMARSNSNILLTGATGVGKELFAQSIHNVSLRRDGPFVAVNCGALVESLLESELFGYEKGAFTGANKNGKQGLFELAHKGTLFLDEIGEMPMHLQVRLLRVLQEKEVVRVGGDMVIPVDVRVIAATNQDLPQMVRRKEFRSDLYYRLNVLPLNIPPLRERSEDIPLLIDYYKQRLNADFILSPQARERLMSYPFPGNVRELRNCVEYLSNLGTAEIRLSDLPSYILADEGPWTEPVRPRPARECLEAGSGDQGGALQVLRAVEVINSTGVGAGRRSIRAYLAGQGCFLSEISIRRLLQELAGQGLIHIQQGRGGVRLAPRGEARLHQR